MVESTTCIKPRARCAAKTYMYMYNQLAIINVQLQVSIYQQQRWKHRRQESLPVYWLPATITHVCRLKLK